MTAVAQRLAGQPSYRRQEAADHCGRRAERVGMKAYRQARVQRALFPADIVSFLAAVVGGYLAEGFPAAVVRGCAVTSRPSS
jgi:hypothetical protein